MKLNSVFLTLLLGIAFFVGCTDDIHTSPQDQSLNGTWKLINLSGGFAGLDENYPSGTITWTFNSHNQTLIIDNNQPTSKSFIFDSGTYNYSIIEMNTQKYLKIDNEEYGELTILSHELIIDQNKISNGVGADGFIMKFEK